MLHLSFAKMLLLCTATVALFFAHVSASSDNVIGPAGFLWPTQRGWSARYQQEGPCGTNLSVSADRTPFPISGGKISLTLADNVAGMRVKVAYGNDPTSQDSFASDLIQAPGGIMAGQQCWNVAASIPAAAGSNGTIQLQYSSHYTSGGSTAGVYYACADVTFQDSVKDEYYSCLNETDTTDTTDATDATESDTTTSSSGSSSSSGGSKGLSKGQKVGIAIGSTVGGAMIVAAVSVCIVLRKHKRLGMGNLGLKHKRQGWKDLELESGIPLPKNAARISQ